MKRTGKTRTFFFSLLLAGNLNIFSQDNDSTQVDQRPAKPKSRFLTGLYVASYFANNYTAGNYGGYGFDINGNRNTFLNSPMYQKIVNEYGGGYGQHDQIADALGVDQNKWEFNESDMPFNMHYTPAILVGANFKIPLSRRSSIIVNVNGTKLRIEGNFTITTLKPASANPAINPNIQTFAIKGGEQRLLFQLGYQHLFGDDDMFNFLLEGGLIGTLAKFDKSMIYINNLQIDLTYSANQTQYVAPYSSKRPIGFGVGAYAGMGANIDVSPKFNVQLIYTPSYEKINIGPTPTLKLQNGIGLRVYYKF